MHQTNWSRELVDFCFDHTKLPTANVRPALHARLFLIQFVNSPFDLLNEQRINGKMKTQNCNYNSNSANQHVFTTKQEQQSCFCGENVLICAIAVVVAVLGFHFPIYSLLVQKIKR